MNEDKEPYPPAILLRFSRVLPLPVRTTPGSPLVHIMRQGHPNRWLEVLRRTVDLPRISHLAKKLTE